MHKKSILLSLLLSCFVSSSFSRDAWKFFLVIKNAERVVLERLGKYYKTLDPGINFKIPFFDVPRQVLWSYDSQEYDKNERLKRVRHFLRTSRIDLRERVYNFPKQFVISQDNVAMEITALVYYQINDAYTAVYGVEDLPLALESITQTTLRNVIGKMHLNETLVSRDKINHELREILHEAATKWGAHVTRVELQEVTPPKDICDSMSRQMKAERDSIAWVLEAEGKKKAEVLNAEGDATAAIRRAEGAKESAIQRAEGEAQARLKEADAEAQAIEMLQRAAGENPLHYLLARRYVEALEAMARSNNKVFVPYNADSLSGRLPLIGELLREQTK
jgi:regulator of protease activity HflC (stomatin/prohibitin superfamily)